MPNLTQSVLKIAVDRAIEYGIPVILASTTGKTAAAMMGIMEGRSVRLIVITHDPKRVYGESRFNPKIREELEKRGHLVIEYRNPWLPPISVTRLFERVFRISSLFPRERRWVQDYGMGGKSCFLIAEKVARSGLIMEGNTVVSVAGTQSGADTALVLRVISVERGYCALKFIEQIGGEVTKRVFCPVQSAI